MTNRAIAIFDSGEGGLTVLRRAWELYPGEHFIYGADSLHFPYGTRTLDDVRELFFRFLDFFLKQNVKAVVIACNTATAAALELSQLKSPVPVIGVVYPGAQKATQTSQTGHIGVLSTQATFASGVYRKAIERYNPEAYVVQWPCPALVTMAEMGNTQTRQARLAVRECLDVVFSHDVDTVVLGCTHFPHMERIFYEEVGDRAAIIDPGYETAKHLQNVLGPLDTLSRGSLSFYTTGSIVEFNRISTSLWPDTVIEAQNVKWTPFGYEICESYQQY